MNFSNTSTLGGGGEMSRRTPPGPTAARRSPDSRERTPRSATFDRKRSGSPSRKSTFVADACWAAAAAAARADDAAVLRAPHDGVVVARSPDDVVGVVARPQNLPADTLADDTELRQLRAPDDVVAIGAPDDVVAVLREH